MNGRARTRLGDVPPTTKKSRKRTRLKRFNPVSTVVEGTTLKRHAPSGRAYYEVEVEGRKKRVYCGKYHGPDGRSLNLETLAEAKRRILEARLGVLPMPETRAPRRTAPVLTVDALGERFLEHVRKRYRSSPSQIPHFEQAVGELVEYGRGMPASEFGPRDLASLQLAMAEQPSRHDPKRSRFTRRTLREYVARIVECFAWATSMDLVDPALHAKLKAVRPLRKGEVSFLRESRKVDPVPAEHVQAVLPYVSRQVGAMIQLQLLTGARPGEVVQLRLCDVDRSADPWEYRPVEHKGKARGDERIIDIGPKAQAA